jgi:hypothetical protein
MPKTQESSWNTCTFCFILERWFYAESKIAARFNDNTVCPAPAMEFLDIILTRFFCSMLFLVSAGWLKEIHTLIWF